MNHRVSIRGWQAAGVRMALTAVVCFAILGPVGPRKLLRAVPPADRAGQLADTDGSDSVQPGVLPEAGFMPPSCGTRTEVREDVRPAGQDPRGRTESSRGPPA
jgi:hypothetical protein